MFKVLSMLGMTAGTGIKGMYIDTQRIEGSTLQHHIQVKQLTNANALVIETTGFGNNIVIGNVDEELKNKIINAAFKNDSLNLNTILDTYRIVSDIKQFPTDGKTVYVCNESVIQSLLGFNFNSSVVEASSSLDSTEEMIWDEDWDEDEE